MIIKKLGEENLKNKLEIIAKKEYPTVSIYAGKIRDVSAITKVVSLYKCKLKFNDEYFEYDNGHGWGNLYIKDIDEIINSQFKTPFNPNAKVFQIQLKIGVTVVIYP